MTGFWESPPGPLSVWATRTKLVLMTVVGDLPTSGPSTAQSESCEMRPFGVRGGRVARRIRPCVTCGDCSRLERLFRAGLSDIG